jgi:hypothetical protein
VGPHLLVGGLDAMAGADGDRRTLAGAAVRCAPDLRRAMNDSADRVSATRPIDAAAAAWEDPPRVYQTDAVPVLTVDGFEGPLDWWLEMARAQKIDLARLSIATLIGGFATAMDAALGRRLDGQLARWAVWTVMAATLTELRSRLLRRGRARGGLPQSEQVCPHRATVSPPSAEPVGQMTGRGGVRHQEKKPW